MYPDFKEFLSVLNDHNVKYLVVGGYAVSEYAQPRTTKDLDVFIQATKRNAGPLLRAMREFGAPLHHLSADDLIEAKLAAGRARDLADAEELRKAKPTAPTAKPQATRAKRKALRKTKPRRS